ncbi:hypothetical protein BOX15_Mlig025366g1 [Macrostomum lignano]|uniref:Protein kinase domain-containing protein n=2 Tax=Macrostomum lignano TaxID=282301 RepID=A0A1I8G4U8_9PLAT|nr:hypothetical protein BOX15_Mlig025366g1 [Macrostomum lignano]
MTVFGGAFSHRFKLMGFKRQSQASSDAAGAPPEPLAAPHPAISQAASHSNSSNSTLSQQQQQQGQLKVRPNAGAINAVQRPPRQQIIIPGDAENSKQSEDEEEDSRPERGAAAAPAGAAAAADAAKQSSVQKSGNDVEDETAAAGSVVECPTGKHQNKKGAVCSCILLEQFADKLATPVVSEWHSSSAASAAAAADPASNSALTAAVALTDFKLSRNRVFQGGQGVVYIVRRGGSGEELVMKFKERRKKQRTKSWKRDLREVFLLKDLRHPFIIELKHAYLTSNFYCLVMDYGSRGSLWSMVCRHGCMPKPIAAYYVACILSAVRYVHRNNFIFRDLKAENVVVMSDYRPRLIDFGMAKSHNKPSVRNTSTSFYFAAYIAPEVYADPKGVTEKVDSWGIGYLALELTVGLGVFKSLPWSQTKHTAPDWRFEMPRRYASRIGRDACRFVEKALDRRPEKRPTLDQLMDFQFLEDIDFRILPSLKPKGIEAYLTKKPDN